MTGLSSYGFNSLDVDKLPSAIAVADSFSFVLIEDGFENDSSSTKDENNVGSHGASGSSVGIKKKKREKQHARLLKLFEDDDELEVEVGIHG
uniref:Uncharacterized protein n=1 Tax=Quercus lobata TaxID=97700 RepID=A0A7N2RDW3_QUELO